MRERFELGVAGPATTGAAATAKPPSRTPAQLQYFVSERIVLEREVASRRDRLAGGRIVVRNGRLMERVIIRRGTPGVAVDWGADWVAVSFEQGTRLVFDLAQAAALLEPGREHEPAGPDEAALARTSYRLRTRKLPDRPKSVTFDGADYEPASATAQACLLVPRNTWTSRRFVRRVLRGRKLAK